MKKERRFTLRWQSVALGTGIGILTMVCASAGAAGWMASGAVGPERMKLFAAGILLLTGLAGGLSALLGGGSAWEGALTALGELVVLMVLNLILNGGKMEGIAVTALALAGGCGAAVLLRLRQGSRPRRRRRRKS